MDCISKNSDPVISHDIGQSFFRNYLHGSLIRKGLYNIWINRFNYELKERQVNYERPTNSNQSGF